MAIPTVNAQAADVMFMTERNRLFAGDAGLADIRRLKNKAGQNDKPHDNEDCPKDADFGKRIRAAMKNLRHNND